MGVFQAWAGWRKYRKLPQQWRNIVFYSESGQDWHYFEALIDVLNGDLERKVTYVTSDSSDPGLNRQHDLFEAICIPAGFFLTLHFQMQKADVVVLTMMDLGNLQFKKSINPVHYIYLFHSLGSTHMVDHANSYDAYDSLFCTGPHHVKELRKRELLAGIKPRHLFEYGHPRLERLLLESDSQQANPSNTGQVPGSLPKSQPESPPVVLIGPTWGEQSIFNSCGDELTGILLNAGFHVIIRPHYQTSLMTPEVLVKLKAKYGNHLNFEFQHRMGESDTLIRSDILICDWSAMAIEYALGLAKPVLFIDLPRRVRNPDWQAFDIEPLEASIRASIGEIVSPLQLEQVPQKVDELLQRKEQFRLAISQLREQLIFNIGSSISKGAAEIARIAENTANERIATEQKQGRSS